MEIRRGFEPFLEGWLHGRAPEQLLRSRRHRDLFRVPGRPSLFGKRLRGPGHRFRGRGEARNLLEAEAAGVCVPRLVARIGEKGSTVLLFEEIDRAVTLENVLDSCRVSPATFRALVRNLGVEIAKLARAGLEHRDLHPGNVLLREADLSAPIICDLYEVSRHDPAGWEEAAVRTTACLLNSLRSGFSATDRLRLIRAAGLPRSCLPRLRRHCDKLRLFRLARARGRATRRTGAVEPVPGGFRRHGYDINAALAKLDGSRSWKDSGKRFLHKLDGGLAARVYDYRGLPGFFRRLACDEGFALWRNHFGLESLGIPTPKLHACVHRGARTIVFGEWLEDAVPLAEHVLTARDRPALAESLGRFIRHLHTDLGVYHPDLTAVNILVRRSPPGRYEFLLLDYAGVRFRRSVPLRRRIYNLAQLNASLTHPVTLTDRCRFFRAYARGDRGLLRRKRGVFRRILEITRKRHPGWPVERIPLPGNENAR